MTQSLQHLPVELAAPGSARIGYPALLPTLLAFAAIAFIGAVTLGIIA
ncbi:hypothetical protein MUU53_18905 [Rhizobium lemnae]|jgi:hypothetical protein|uniref:Uncharacterized protein n=2 Tax=Rhizobium TaxID=379 RepID=A0A7W6PSB8_9HYPH|nr:MULTISPECIES: hypothetical protein [Rhizobium]MBB4144824.1 hypothetical protein [Rhizobium rhizoryzae]MCJ8509968.1 hypothetical protein [Rhizobium lemnae]